MMEIEVEKNISGEARKSLPVIFRLFLPFASNVRFMANSELFSRTRETTQEKLLMAGYAQVITPEDFIAVRILSGSFAVFMFILCAFSGKPVLGVMLLICLLIYPAAWLNTSVKKRHMEIMKALPNVLDLLTLSVEAGRDFLTALKDILSRRKLDALGEELSRTFREIQLGKSRRNALKDLSLRVRQPDLTAVLNAIIQAEELGVSIGQLLRIQGDMLRNKRFTQAEKLANEAPVKILFPVVAFIFPAVIIILMVPILMQAFKVLTL
jgi:tight adherence protein C